MEEAYYSQRLCMKNKISGKTVLITGASSGIGRQLAFDLAAAGAQVLLIARRRERLRAVQQQIEIAGGKAGIWKCDLADRNARQDLIAHILLEENPIDILINNAGFGWYGYYSEMPGEIVSGIIEVNINAMLELTRAILPGMRGRGKGHIINIGSIAGGFPNQGVAVYSASKAFLDAFTTALHRELRGSGVQVSVARLGPVKTEFFDSARSIENGRRVPGEIFSIPVERAARAIERLMFRPQRVIYVPAYLQITRLVENLFGGLIDRMGPLLLKHRVE